MTAGQHSTSKRHVSAVIEPVEWGARRRAIVIRPLCARPSRCSSQSSRGPCLCRWRPSQRLRCTWRHQRRTGRTVGRRMAGCVSSRCVGEAGALPAARRSTVVVDRSGGVEWHSLPIHWRRACLLAEAAAAAAAASDRSTTSTPTMRRDATRHAHGLCTALAVDRTGAAAGDRTGRRRAEGGGGSGLDAVIARCLCTSCTCNGPCRMDIAMAFDGMAGWLMGGRATGRRDHCGRPLQTAPPSPVVRRSFVHPSLPLVCCYTHLVGRCSDVEVRRMGRLSDRLCAVNPVIALRVLTCMEDGSSQWHTPGVNSCM